MTSIVPSDGSVRVCSSCKDPYPATSEYFHRDSHNKDVGLHSQCRVCRNTHATVSKDRVLDAAQSLTYRQRLRMQVLRHYGGDNLACACCGEWRLPFLALDHIDGGGKEHRKALGPNASTYTMYRWIVNNSYPGGFRVLCHNCNCALGFYGRCPHDDERAMEVDAG